MFTSFSDSRSPTGSPERDMKNHRRSPSSDLSFWVVMGRECRWPFSCRVVNIANLMCRIRSHNFSGELFWVAMAAPVQGGLPTLGSGGASGLCDTAQRQLSAELRPDRCGDATQPV